MKKFKVRILEEKRRWNERRLMKMMKRMELSRDVTEDTHVIITALINPEGQQQSSSVSSGFVSNMLNPSPDTDFLNKLDDNIKKIIKDQVKKQVKAQVSKNLPKIKKTVNEQIEAEVMNRSSTKSKTSLVIAANLSELELKKILIDKMESNMSIHRSDEQKNLYKALVDAITGKVTVILDTYRDTVSFKRRRDDEDKDEEPRCGFTPGVQKKKEPASTSATKEKTSKTSWLSNMKSWWSSNTSFEESLQGKPLTIRLEPPEGLHYPHEYEKPTTIDTQFSASSFVIPFDHFINNDLEYLSDGVSSQKYAASVTKTKAVDYGHIKWIEDLGRKRQQFYGFDANNGIARDVYPNAEYCCHKACEIVYWHNTSILIGSLFVGMMKAVQFKSKAVLKSFASKTSKTSCFFLFNAIDKFTIEGTGPLAVNLLLKNVHTEIEALSFQRRDGTLNDVRTALNDRLKGIRMEYLPQTIWRQSDKDKAGAMIQAIDKQLKTKKIMRSLENFVGGRPYEGDFWLLQRTYDYKMDSMHSILSMYYDYDAHVKGELLVMMKNSQSVNLLIFISNTLIELFNDFGFDCDGIPKRPTMYLNLWSYKVVRYRYSNPIIQPEPEGSTQGYPLDSVEVHRYDTKGEKNIRVILLTVKMEILLEPTSNKLMVGDDKEFVVMGEFGGDPLGEGAGGKGGRL
ncbi:hypothetical protein Tco_0798364 [Tanacetum coccineum]